MPPGLLAHGQNESSPQFSTPRLPMIPVRKRQFWETLGRRLVELAKGSGAAPRRRLLASCGSELGGSGIVYMLLRASLHGPAAQGVVVIT